MNFLVIRMLTTLLLLLIVSSLDTVKCGGAKRPSPPKSPTRPSPPKSPTPPSPPKSPTPPSPPQSPTPPSPPKSPTPPSPPQSPTRPSPPQSPTLPSPQIALQKVAMVWPQTWCHKPNSQCAQQIPSTFSLHGIWPSDSHGTSIDNCAGEVFDGTILRLEKEKIKKYWLGFDNNYESMWRHEWDVHGKCSGLRLKKYFEKGVELSMSLTNKIDDAFSKESIKPDPSKHYEARYYLNAIASFFKFQPQIRCVQYEDEGSTKTYLKEILFCYDVNLLRLINCPGNNAYSKDCGGPNSQIYFP